MLLTRCPHCQTTFRITAEALSKADGQVRCGRCANVFNAYTALSEKAAEPTQGTTEASEGTDLGAIEHIEISSDGIETGLKASFGSEPETVTAETANEATAEVLPVSAAEPPAWALQDEAQRPRALPWGLAVASALVMLLVQVAHHFRKDLAANSLLGPPLQAVYAQLGAPIVPRWDVQQYQVLDWVATAEPTASGQGNLIIEARIRNRGPQAQPYPHVQLKLKDRWESAIGSRVFEPREYLGMDERSLMRPGSTAQARLAVVDPGPDAYGFELDICVASGSKQLICSTDEVYE